MTITDAAAKVAERKAKYQADQALADASKEELDAAEGVMWKEMENAGMSPGDVFKAAGLKFCIQEKLNISYVPAMWDAMMKAAAEAGIYNLVERRMGSNACRELILNGPLPVVDGEPEPPLNIVLKGLKAVPVKSLQVLKA